MPTVVRRALVGILALLLLAVGVAPAASTTATLEWAAYAELVRLDSGSVGVRVVLGEASSKSMADAPWTAYADAVDAASSGPSGTVSVSSGGRDLGTYDLAVLHDSIVRPATFEIEMPDAVRGTTLTLVYSGDRYLRPGTRTLTVLGPVVEITPTIDSIAPNGDGTFAVHGSIHIAASDVPTGPLDASRVTLEPLESWAIREPLSPPVTVALGTATTPSELPGFATRRPWSAPRMTLEFDHKAPVRVTVDAQAPYAIPSFGGYVSVDTVQLSVRETGDGRLEVSHLRGPDRCDLINLLRFHDETGDWTNIRWAPRADGGYCRGTVDGPAGHGLTRIGVELMYPFNVPLVWLDLNLSLAPRSVTLGHQRTTTQETITVTATPRPQVTVLEAKGSSGAWTEAQRSSAATPAFTVPRADAPVTYRVRVLEDDGARGASSGEFTVQAPPARAAAERGIGIFGSQGACAQRARDVIAQSGDEWNGFTCVQGPRIWGRVLWLGTVTYTP